MDERADRISVDQDEQERLRFSADDIVRLPVHTAINLWVARGTPRGGFYARTKPMEELYDPAVAEGHLAAQRDRGGHHLDHLPAPVGAAAHRHAASGVEAAVGPAASEAGDAVGNDGTHPSRRHRRPRLRPVGETEPKSGPPDADPVEEVDDLL